MLISNEFLAILPFALASAVSPLLFTFSLLVASQKEKSLLKSLLFILGAGIAISLVGFIIFFLLAKLSPSTTFKPRDAYIDLIIGVVLVLFAARQFIVKKPKGKKPSRNISLLGALSIGFGFMLANTSTIIMYFPAAHVASFYSTSIKFSLLAIMVVFSLVPAIVPPALLKLIRSEKTIESIKSFVNAKGRYIIAIVFAVLGIFEIIKALKVLL